MKDFRKILLTLLFTIIAVNCDDRCERFPHGTFLGDGTCTGYIYCDNGVSTKGVCPNGLQYHFREGVCAPESEVRCKENTCGPNSDGKYFADKRKRIRCGAYYYCNGGVAQNGVCPDGQHFKEESQSCVWPSSPPNCVDDVDDCEGVQDGFKVPDSTDCQKFKECKNGKTNIPTKADCGADERFDIRTAKCENAQQVSECASVPKKCTNNSPLKQPGLCRVYYECENGEAPKPKTCPEYELFDGARCIEQMDVDDKLCPNRCEGRDDGFAPAYRTNPRDCKEIHFCKDMKVTGSSKCPDTNAYFNDKTQQCSKSPTEPKCRK